MGRFWSVLRRLVNRPFQHMEGLTTVNKVLTTLGLSSVIPLAYLLSREYPIPWWVTPLAILVTAYLFWCAGRAVEIARGPQACINPVQLDEPPKIFYVRIKNGPIRATITIRVTGITDSSGHDLLERSWEGHWRGRGADFAGDLGPSQKEQYGILGVAPGPNGNPSLYIYSRESRHDSAEAEHTNPTFIFCSKDVPLE
jgi:hypothetical protein